MKAYHASDKKFDKFSIETANSREHKEKFNALWFSTDKEYVKQFGKYIYTVDIKGNYIKEEQFDLGDELSKEFCQKNKIKGHEDDGIALLETKYGQKFADFLQEKGYDGYIFHQHKGKTIICFNPETIELKAVDLAELNESTSTLEKTETLPELNDNFWRWFGDSVVKDDDGNPLICFHGSTLDIDEFDTEYSGKNTGNNEEKVFYFTTDREMAVSYSTEAIIRQKEIPYYDKEEGTEYETWEEFEDYLRTEVCKTPHINPCFICMEKPYIYDAGFRDFDPKLNYTLMSMIKGEIDTSHWLFDEELYYEIAEEHEQYDEETDEYIQIKDFDYDGIIIKNVRDSISPLVDNYVDEYIVWHPNQIKSIYNKGNWSWNSHNVFETLNKKIERYL